MALEEVIDMKLWICSVLVLIGFLDVVKATTIPKHPLTFNNWKRVQIHNSQTEVVKKSKEIKQLKSRSKADKMSPSDLKNLTDQLNREENLQKKNLEKLQFSKELNFEAYFDVYLKKYAKDSDALEYIAKRLSKKSVVYLLERSMRDEKKNQSKVKAPLKSNDSPAEIKSSKPSK